MPIITDVEHRSEQDMGKFAPRADQNKYRSAFAVVEGKRPVGWKSVRDLTSNGIPIHTGNEGRVVYQEFTDPATGKPNDVILEDGTVVRECVILKEDSEKVAKIEGGISSRQLNDFIHNNNLNRNEENNQVRMSAEVSTSEQNTQFKDVSSGDSTERRPRGRPKQT